MLGIIWEYGGVWLGAFDDAGGVGEVLGLSVMYMGVGCCRFAVEVELRFDFELVVIE